MTTTYEYEIDEYEDEDEFGYQAESDGEFGEELGDGEVYSEEIAQLGGEYESPLSETEEMELASRLLDVSSEAELEQFLGGLMRKVSRKVGGFLKSKTGRALGGILKNVARRALPVVGGAVGSFVAPGVGTAIGTRLGSYASRLFEVELEAMDPEEGEFEIARRYVRLAAAATRNAARARGRMNPHSVARASTLAAARRYAPGLARRFGRYARPASWYWPQPVSPAHPPEPDTWGEPDGDAAEMDRSISVATSGGNGHRAESGRWVRRGRKLIVLGI